MFLKKLGLTFIGALSLGAHCFGMRQVFLHNASDRSFPISTLMRYGPVEVASVLADGTAALVTPGSDQAFCGLIQPRELLIFQVPDDCTFFHQVLSIDFGKSFTARFLTHLHGGLKLHGLPDGWSVRGQTNPEPPAGVPRIRLMEPWFAQITLGLDDRKTTKGSVAPEAGSGLDKPDREEKMEGSAGTRTAHPVLDLRAGAGGKPLAGPPPVIFRHRRLDRLEGDVQSGRPRPKPAGRLGRPGGSPGEPDR